MEFFLTCNGIPLHISDTKKGDKTLIFLHGYLETLYIWEEFVTPLKENFRVVSLDLPGHGLSGTYPINTMELIAASIIEAMDKLSINQAYIVGHSMGGYVASHCLANYPNRFTALIMLHSTPFADSPQKALNRDREIELIFQNKLQQIVKLSIPNMFATQNISQYEEKILEISEIAELHDPEGITASLKGMKARIDYSSALSSAPQPIAFIFGKEDNYILPATVEEIKQQLPRAKYYLLQHSGHNGFIEEPMICANYLNDFINSI